MSELPRIRLLGDIACPWTYLALGALINAFGRDLPLEWHPFLLHTADFARQRERLAAPVAGYARRLGAPFVTDSLSQPVRGPLAHGVVLAAAEEGRTIDALAALFAARFDAGAALADEDSVEAALSAGVGRATAHKWLVRGLAKTTTAERATRSARLAGVSEIPLVVVANSYVIGGLQPAEAYRALAELAQIEAADRT